MQYINVLETTGLEDYMNLYGQLGNSLGIITSPLFLIGLFVVVMLGFVLIYIIKYYSTISMIKKGIKQALDEYEGEREKQIILFQSPQPELVPIKKDSQ